MRGLPIAPTPLMGQRSIYQTCCCCDRLGLGTMPCHGSEVSSSHHGRRTAEAGPYHTSKLARCKAGIGCAPALRGTEELVAGKASYVRAAAVAA